MERMILVRFLHPEKDETLELTLDASVQFSELTEKICSCGFVIRQKPGYMFLCSGHLCSPTHALSDYLPKDARILELQVFGMPQIMV